MDGDVCQCAAAGFCERRQVRIPNLLWLKCKTGNVAGIDDLYSPDKLNTSSVVAHVATTTQIKIAAVDKTLLSSRLKSHIESETGTPITCGVCLAYLRDLDKARVLDHNTVAKQLAIHVQMSESFKRKNGLEKHLQRVQWMSKTIEPLIPKPPTEIMPPATIVADNPPMTFIWPYWHGGARGDELRFSMRSVLQHYGPEASLIVVGDRPPWYSGTVLHQERIPQCARHSYSDMVAKMKTISIHPMIPSEGIWIMDDTYFMHPVTLEDMKTPRAYAWDKQTGSDWRRIKKKTMQFLGRRKKPQHDYATHLPHHFEKEKLRSLWDLFPFDKEPLLWEIVYGNMFLGTPILPTPFLRRLMTKDDVTVKKLLTSPVVNNADTIWNGTLEHFLKERFPSPSRFEIDK